MANKNSNTNTTNTNATVESLMKLATDPSMQTAEAFHEIWEEGKRTLSRPDQTRLWEGLTAIRKNDFAGKKWTRSHPDEKASAPAWAKAPKEPEKHPIAAPKAPAKQEKKAAPAKQEKAAPKAKEPTAKQILADMLVAMNAMDQTMRSMDKRLTAIEKKLAK